jgi:dihydrofolate synthase/folylpolyglutamate synthase
MMYQQALDYLSSYTDYEKMPMPHDPVFYDLRRVDDLLAHLGNPHLKASSVHITGTNGKGSVAAMVASVLSASGYTTGLYTSPHLHTWRERIRVDNELISEEELISVIEMVKPEVEAVNQRATGGRFDATSVISPDVCIITSISYDHVEVLGNSLEEITAEKAAIIKPDSFVVTSSQPDEVNRVIEGTCHNGRARLVRVGSDVTWRSLGFNLTRQLFEVSGRLGEYKLSIPLLGHHQLENAATAVAALEILAEKGFNITPEDIARGMAGVNWPGRFQILSLQPLVIVDGAHNTDSARRLKQSLEQYFGLLTRRNKKVTILDDLQHIEFERATLITGVSCDKDIAGIVSELYSLFDRVIVTRSQHPRAMAPELLKLEFAKHGVEAQIADDIPMAFSWALTGAKDLVCIAGSLFVVGEAIEQANM